MQCPNEQCRQEFDYRESGTIVPGGKDKEPIKCPKCGEIAGFGMTSGYFESYAVVKRGE